MNSNFTCKKLQVGGGGGKEKSQIGQPKNQSFADDFLLFIFSLIPSFNPDF